MNNENDLNLTTAVSFFLCGIGMMKLIDHLYEKIIKPIKPINNYQRARLAEPPAFGIFVGDLLDIVKEIEMFLIEMSKKDSREIRKETIPFMCLVNPPRHGKSLLIDKLFTDNDTDVLVIPITYNTGTPFLPLIEMVDVSTALNYFWLRVYKALTATNKSLTDLQKDFSGFPLGLSEVIDLAKKVIDPSVFERNGEQRSILICVDEFSLLTDVALKEQSDLNRQVNYWDDSMRREFIGRLHIEKRLSKPFVQFFFTGFHKNMNGLMGVSAKVQSHTLKISSFETSRPLLKRIIEEYVKYDRKVPLLLLEAVKCTPGLIGEWAERVSRRNFDSDERMFRQDVVWLDRISDDDNIGKNWNLVKKFIEYSECADMDLNSLEKLDDLSEELVAAEIGVKDSSESSLVPMCFVLITNRSYKFEKCTRDWELQNLLSAVIQCCRDKDEQQGAAFESFILYALQTRLLLRCVDKELKVTIPIDKLLPGFAYFGHVGGDSSRCFYFHAICTKRDLQTFLLPTLYYLFPVGLEALNDNTGRSSSLNTGLLDWITDCGTVEFNLAKINHSEIQQDPAVCVRKTLSINSGDKPQRVSIVQKSTTKVTLPSDEFMQAMFDYVKEFYRTHSWNMKNHEQQVIDKMEELADIYSCDQMIVKNWWGRLNHACKSLVRCFDDNASFVLPAESAEGLDLILIWSEDCGTTEDSSESSSEIESKTEEGAEIVQKPRVHVSAIEIKDRRYTEHEEWQRKMQSLTSLKCAVWWLQNFCQAQYEVKFHIVFAGREHSEDETH